MLKMMVVGLVGLVIGCAGSGIVGDGFPDDMRVHAAAAHAFYGAAGRWPRSTAELAEGAGRAGVRFDPARFQSMAFDPAPDGGLTLRWTEGTALVRTEVVFPLRSPDGPPPTGGR
ncbi:MAG: hypothetical protein JWO31_598 [Phycisphaerales bacterium]|nr:hypothetical protein [Phycisphaerales bacterium]